MVAVGGPACFCLPFNTPGAATSVRELGRPAILAVVRPSYPHRSSNLGIRYNTGSIVLGSKSTGDSLTKYLKRTNNLFVSMGGKFQLDYPRILAAKKVKYVKVVVYT